MARWQAAIAFFGQTRGAFAAVIGAQFIGNAVHAVIAQRDEHFIIIMAAAAIFGVGRLAAFMFGVALALAASATAQAAISNAMAMRIRIEIL